MLQDKMMNCMTVIVGKAVSASGARARRTQRG